MKTVILVSLFVLLQSNLVAQQKLFPKKQYPLGSLGYELQTPFGKQCEYCSAIERYTQSRDYIPSDIRKFTRLDLDSTFVESINVNGISLLRYVFTSKQRGQPFYSKRFVPLLDRVLDNIDGLPDGFEIVNSRDFPAFVYTTNCSNMIQLAAKGQVRAAAGALSAAVDMDNRKVTALYAYEGWFRSPLTRVLLDKNAQTTSLMLNLWNFYISHPDYNGNAFYLSQFKGLTIGRTGTNEQFKKLETSVGINVNGGIGSVEANSNTSLAIKNYFLGTDYQTFIYEIFDESYPRVNMFKELPNSKSIINYMKNIRYDISYPDEGANMANGMSHIHYVDIEGFPTPFINENKWQLVNLNDTCYEKGTMAMRIIPHPSKTNVIRFEVSGVPNRTNFGKVPNSLIGVSYDIVSTDSINKEIIRIPVSKYMNTTSHPIPVVLTPNAKWSITDASNGKFTISWRQNVLFTDSDNPVDYSIGKTAQPSVIELKNGEQTITATALLTCESDKQYYLTITTKDDFSYNDYDLTANPSTAVFHGTFSIPLKKRGSYAVKPLETKLNFPVQVKRETTILPQ